MELKLRIDLPFRSSIDSYLSFSFDLVERFLI